MTCSPRRPWFRFHLLTLVLMMLAAGIVLWIRVGRQIVHGETQSAWVEQDGLAARIAIGNCTLTTESPSHIRLDLKNVGDKPFRIYKYASGWEDVRIQPVIDKPMKVSTIPDSVTFDPPLSDFVVLTPAQQFQYELRLSIDEMRLVYAWNKNYDLSQQQYGAELDVTVHFSNGLVQPHDMDGNPDSALAGMPIWKGTLVRRPFASRSTNRGTRSATPRSSPPSAERCCSRRSSPNSSSAAARAARHERNLWMRRPGNDNCS